MIWSLLVTLFNFILFLYCKATGDETVIPWIYFIIGLINLAVWTAEYTIDRIKKHIDEKLKP